MASKQWLPPAVRTASVERTLTAGETLFRCGDRAAGIYEVVRGYVRLARIDAAGREIVLHVAGPGGTIAEASLFAAIYHCDATANTDAAVRFYPKALMLAEFARDPELAQSFMAMLAQEIMALRARLEQRNVRSARERIRQYLAAHTESDGRTVLLSGTLKQVAGEIGLTHEALYRTLSEMAAAREIERQKTIIRLIDH